MSRVWTCDAVGPGWKSIVQPLIDLCAREGVEIHQIKEKFGGLRFYVHATAPEHVKSAIKQAMEVSGQTCEQCGAPGKPIGRPWIKVVCEAHLGFGQ